MLLIGVDTVGSTGEFLGALAMIGAALAYALGAMFAKLRFARRAGAGRELRRLRSRPRW